MKRFVCIALLAAAQGASAQDTLYLRGRVVDTEGAPIPMAQVTAKGNPNATTNDSGVFVMPLKSKGRITLQAQRLGYMPARLNLDIRADTTIEVFLLPRAQSLPAQTVVARARAHLDRVGFYDRMRDAENGSLYGYFIPPDSLEARHSDKITDIVNRVPGLRLKDGGAGGGLLITGSDGCLMTLYLDGSRFDMNSGASMANGTGAGAAQLGMTARTPAGMTGGGTLKAEGIDRIIHPSHIAGIEIYPRGTNAPIQYQSFNGQCGIVALWTKGGAEPAAFRKR